MSSGEATVSSEELVPCTLIIIPYEILKDWAWPRLVNTALIPGPAFKIRGDRIESSPWIIYCKVLMKFKGKSGAALRKLSVEPGRVSSSRAAWRACEGQQLKEICWGAADQKIDSELARNNKQLTATSIHPSSSSWWERSLLTARCEKMYQQLSQGTCQGSRISTKAGTWQSRKLHDYAKKLEQFE